MTAPGTRLKVVVFAQNRAFFGTQLLHLPLLHNLKKWGSDDSHDNTVILFSPFKLNSAFVQSGIVDHIEYYQTSLIRMTRMLRSLRPDVIVSLRPQSSWLNLAIGMSGAPIRLGYQSPGSHFFYSHTVPRNTQIYRGLNYLNLLKTLQPPLPLPDFFLHTQRRAERQPEQFITTICLLPGGGAGEFKRWGIENYLQLAHALKQHREDIGFIFILGSDEADYVPVINASPLALHCDIYMNESVENCSRAMASAHLCIANDCGPAHIAQMLMRPFIGIFSNADGDVEARIAEWFNPHEHARTITSSVGEAIHTIPVETVKTLALELLDNNIPPANTLN
jgi:ADP-heptose:LPS heptosyltransferase